MTLENTSGMGGVNIAGPALAPKRRKRKKSIAETVEAVLGEMRNGRR